MARLSTNSRLETRRSLRKSLINWLNWSKIHNTLFSFLPVRYCGLDRCRVRTASSEWRGASTHTHAQKKKTAQQLRLRGERVTTKNESDRWMATAIILESWILHVPCLSKPDVVTNIWLQKRRLTSDIVHTHNKVKQSSWQVLLF